MAPEKTSLLEHDPRGLIVESYRIDGISISECRSIFFDWAMSAPPEADVPAILATFLRRYEGEFPEHPMTAVLREGLVKSGAPRRRGGWRSRRTLV